MTRFSIFAAAIDHICHCEGACARGNLSPREKRKCMDFYKVPIGFGMALAVNEPAMNAYAVMTEAQKQEILNKAHNVRSEREMHDLVASLANGTTV